MQVKSLQLKIAGLAGLCLLGTSVALVGYDAWSAHLSRSFVQEQTSGILDRKTREGLTTLASTESASIRFELDSAFSAARNTARTFEQVAGPNSPTPLAARREQLNSILLAVLKDNPRFNGTYSAWEPNGVDGNDRAYVNRRSVGSDATGRFLSYWTRDDRGHIAVQPLVEYNSRELHSNGLVKGGWYLGPQGTGRESILGPLPYIVQGKQVNLATMSVPITIGGKFHGVAGADFNLDFVQKVAEGVDQSIYNGKAAVTILNSDGLVVAASKHPEMIGESFKKLDPRWSDDLSIVHGGRPDVINDSQSDQIKVFSPIQMGRSDTPWSVLISVPDSVAMAEANALSDALAHRSVTDMWALLGVAIAITTAGVTFLWFAGRSISRPILASARFAEGVAAGELDQVLDVSTVDETGILAAALRKMAADIKRSDAERLGAQEDAEGERLERQRLAEAERLERQQGAEAERVARDKANEVDRKATSAQIADDLEASIRAIVDGLSGAAQKMDGAAAGMTDSADQATEQANLAATISTQASANAENVATATEELSASIRAIAKQVETSTQKANSAVHSVERADQQISGLMAAAEKIGMVVDLISAIADQTNLLALNATIEAARAGEDGRGFTVVASEVKKLATRTADATREIGQQIGAVQRIVNQTVGDIREIGGMIAESQFMTTNIALAITEQTSATKMIAENIQDAAASTKKVTGSITDVSKAAMATRKDATEVRSAATALAHEAENLNSVVDGFLHKMRSA